MALETGVPGTGFIWRILVTAPQGGPGELREHGRLREVKHLAEVTQKVLELGFKASLPPPLGLRLGFCHPASKPGGDGTQAGRQGRSWL